MTADEIAKRFSRQLTEGALDALRQAADARVDPDELAGALLQHVPKELNRAVSILGLPASAVPAWPAAEVEKQRSTIAFGIALLMDCIKPRSRRS